MTSTEPGPGPPCWWWATWRTAPPGRWTGELWLAARWSRDLSGGIWLAGGCRATTEARVMFEWNCGYREVSALTGAGVRWAVIGCGWPRAHLWLVSSVFLDLVHRLNSAKQNLGPDLTETIGSYNIPANLMTRRKSLPQVLRWYLISLNLLTCVCKVQVWVFNIL